jgi:hypothetical protein
VPIFAISNPLMQADSNEPLNMEDILTDVLFLNDKIETVFGGKFSRQRVGDPAGPRN